MFHVIIYPSKYLNRILLYSVFFSLCISFVCNGQTVINYGQWRNLSTGTKTVYVSGMIDYILNSTCENCLEKVAGRALKRCLNEFQISNPEISIMIDNFYLHAENWKLSPQKALEHQLIDGFCKTYSK